MIIVWLMFVIGLLALFSLFLAPFAVTSFGVEC